MIHVRKLFSIDLSFFSKLCAICLFPCFTKKHLVSISWIVVRAELSPRHHYTIYMDDFSMKDSKCDFIFFLDQTVHWFIYFFNVKQKLIASPLLGHCVCVVPTVILSRDRCHLWQRFLSLVGEWRTGSWLMWASHATQTAREQIILEAVSVRYYYSISRLNYSCFL